MDVLELYQEEAAKKMEVSRPTFTRILKNGRKKLTNALVSGHKINIQTRLDDIVVAICLKEQDIFDNISLNMNFIIFYKIKDGKITTINKIKNPLLDQTQKPAIVLPKIGEGLKDSLLSKGIQPIVKDKITLNEIKNFL